MERFISDSEEETKVIGRGFASELKKGDVVVLSGELGSGKTKFAEGVLSFFGLENEISSPTFNIVNEYIKDDFYVYHFDVYRLEDVDEFYAIGGDEYFDKGICLIEWGELILEALPNRYIQVAFERNFEDDNKREIVIEEIVK